jgi:hypothetical protein
MRQHAPLDPGQAAWELLPLFFATQAIDIAHARCGAATENGRNTDRRYFPGERSVNDAAPACFCAIRFARRTASGIATGAWSRTNASPAAASCRSTCFHVGEINDSQERAVSRGSLRGDSAGRLDRLVEAERASVPAAAMGRPAGWRSLWEELQPDRFWTSACRRSARARVGIPELFVLVAYRLLAPRERLAVASGWFERTALADLFGGDFGLAHIHKLYRCHDRLLEHKRGALGSIT